MTASLAHLAHRSLDRTCASSESSPSGSEVRLGCSAIRIAGQISRHPNDTNQAADTAQAGRTRYVVCIAAIQVQLTTLQLATETSDKQAVTGNFTSVCKAFDLHVASQGSRTRKVLFRISPTCTTKRKICVKPDSCLHKRVIAKKQNWWRFCVQESWVCRASEPLLIQRHSLRLVDVVGIS